MGSALTEEPARAFYAQCEEAMIFALLAQAKIIAEQQAQAAQTSHQTPSTPSSMKSHYQKPERRRIASNGRGRKNGHSGNRRQAPSRIGRCVERRTDVCLDCGGRFHRCADNRTGYTEDIPENHQSEVAEHTIHRDWCPRRKKKIEPSITDAMPGDTPSNRVLVFTDWLHSALGTTLSKIIAVFNFHLALKVRPAGFMQMRQCLGRILLPWYGVIQAEALSAGVLHPDETNWGVNAKNQCMWCFSTVTLSYPTVERSRGSPALLKVEFGSTLVSDFWGTYNALACAARQKCLFHLLRHLEHVEKYDASGPNRRAGAKVFRRPTTDAVRLRRLRDGFPPAADRKRIVLRLEKLIDMLCKGPRPEQGHSPPHREMSTFLDQLVGPFARNPFEPTI